MSGPRAPVAGARLGIDLAVRALPSRADRDRYYAEYVAELYGLPPATQLGHVAGFLSQAFALRAALGDSRAPTEERAVDQTPSLAAGSCAAPSGTTTGTPAAPRTAACTCPAGRASGTTPTGWDPAPTSALSQAARSRSWETR